MLGRKDEKKEISKEERMLGRRMPKRKDAWKKQYKEEIFKKKKIQGRKDTRQSRKRVRMEV